MEPLPCSPCPRVVRTAPIIDHAGRRAPIRSEATSGRSRLPMSWRGQLRRSDSPRSERVARTPSLDGWHRVLFFLRSSAGGFRPAITACAGLRDEQQQQQLRLRGQSAPRAAGALRAGAATGRPPPSDLIGKRRSSRRGPGGGDERRRCDGANDRSEWVVNQLDDVTAQLEGLNADSDLPPRPDPARIDEFLVAAYQQQWQDHAPDP
jgi:hypothetical protein